MRVTASVAAAAAAAPTFADGRLLRVLEGSVQHAAAGSETHATIAATADKGSIEWSLHWWNLRSEEAPAQQELTVCQEVLVAPLPYV